MLRFISVFLICMITNCIHAQTIRIQGRILDEHNELISSAAIQCYGENKSFLGGTISGTDGKFIIKQAVGSFHNFDILYKLSTTCTVDYLQLV